MNTRRSLSARLGGVVRSIGRATAALLTLAALASCDPRERTPTGTDGVRPVQLSMAASISAAPGAVVDAIAEYTISGSAPVRVGFDSLIIDTGGADSQLALTADVSDCLAAASGGPCLLSVRIRLKRNGVVLDEATRALSIAADVTEITVPPVELFEVSSVVITLPNVPPLELGDSVQLSATALDRTNAAVPARNVTWSVTGTSVTVSASGLLRTAFVGTSTVRATIGGRSQTLQAVVGPPSVAQLTMTPADTTVFVGGTVTYRVTARTSTGLVLTGVPLGFFSDNASLATVNGSGVAAAVAAGQTTMRVQASGRGGAPVVASAILRINPLAIAVNPTTLSFDTEQNQPLPAAQNVAVTSLNGGNVGTLSLVTPIDTLLTATLNGSTAPTTLTIRPSRALAPGLNLTRNVVIRSSNPAVANVVIPVTITGRTPAATFGRFSGVVVNAVSSAPVGQATVAIRTLANVLVDQVFTAGNGAWTSATLTSGTYNITVSASGFQTVIVQNQFLAGGPSIPVTSLATVRLPSVSAGAGAIFGSVRNATTGDALDSVIVELRAGANNSSGAPVATTSTNDDGAYLFSAQPSGTYTVRATKAGFADGAVTVVVAGTTTLAPVAFLSPVGANVAWRFVLSWGSTPQDLDGHLTGPLAASASRFHVFFGDPGSLVASPFARLDVDVTFGFGPETITMSQQIAGVYRFYVYNFSGETPLSGSNARVDVYQGNTLVRQYFPPQQSGLYWTVFEISGSTITPIGTIGDVQPAITLPGPRRRAETRAAQAAAEFYQLGPWTWKKAERR
jgi:Carboxypeptidase regulatory-like domain